MAYDEKGSKVWERQLDIYGKVKEEEGQINLVPFGWQGMYFDEEIDLYNVRFRYYDPSSGIFTQSDPIGLAGNNPNIYAYVGDSNTWIDPLGLKCAHVDDKGVLNLKNKFPEGSDESKQLVEFVKKWNKEIANNGGSMTRQAVSKSTRRKASRAAKKHKLENPSQYSNGEVAGHISDVGWGGKVDGPFMPLSSSVNSYVGGATQAVSVGTNYSSVVLI